jgi:hypothetical protein
MSHPTSPNRKPVLVAAVGVLACGLLTVAAPARQAEPDDGVRATLPNAAAERQQMIAALHRIADGQDAATRVAGQADRDLLLVVRRVEQRLMQTNERLAQLERALKEQP